jgi:hypothetical protein
LVLAATDLQPFDFGDPGAAELLLARCRSLATADGVLTEDLELAAMPSGPATMLRLRNKHYFFQLAASPTPANQHPGKDAIAPLEVIAWPREQPSPAHTAFFASDVAEPAYTRNLQADYVGDGEQAPKAGDAYRRTDPTFERVWSYRSNNDERWLLNRRLRVRGSS